MSVSMHTYNIYKHAQNGESGEIPFLAFDPRHYRVCTFLCTFFASVAICIGLVHINNT